MTIFKMKVNKNSNKKSFYSHKFYYKFNNKIDETV